MKQDNSSQVTAGVTLPAEANKEDMVLELARKWGADAIRDSDGTKLSPGLLDVGYDIYSTICLVRADQDWPRKHWDQLPQKFLMTPPKPAVSETLEIDVMEDYFDQKYEIDTNHDPHEYWEVIDRTTGQVVPTDDWSFDKETGKVTIVNACPFHVYTVNFMIYQIWDFVSMYNHLQNNWTCDHVISVDPVHEETYNHLMKFFEQWLEEHPHTDVVRLTTLAYPFTIDSFPDSSDKYRDWTGYCDAISPKMLDAFAKAKGYQLSSEDFVDQGYYNATYRVPSQKYLDWMEFIHDFVLKFGKDVVDRVHAAGKKAAIFFGDHWAGVEPFSPRYKEMGIDINVGAVEDGTALRRVSDIPGDEVKEVRFYPYFFPDVFHPGGNPTQESLSNWIKIRRALLRKPVDRIGYGGYLSLANEFPDFIDHVTELCEEFRTFCETTKKTPAFTPPVKVAVLDAWGVWRSWITHIGPTEKFHTGRADVMQFDGSNALECLTGLPVEVVFLSFRDLLKDGIPEDVNVLLNDGAANTAWSGGDFWKNPEIVSMIREFVYNGGGFVGVTDPSACEHQGRFYQLADILGVQKEVAQTINALPFQKDENDQHFISQDLSGRFDTAAEKSFVFVCDRETDVIQKGEGGHVHLAAKDYGKGRGVYFAGLPYNLDNARLLHRALFWAAGKEDCMKQWFSTNPYCDCAAYPEVGKAVVVNNSDSEQTTEVLTQTGESRSITLAPYKGQWFDM